MQVFKVSLALLVTRAVRVLEFALAHLAATRRGYSELAGRCEQRAGKQTIGVH